MNSQATRGGGRCAARGRRRRPSVKSRGRCNAGRASLMLSWRRGLLPRLRFCCSTVAGQERPYPSTRRSSHTTPGLSTPTTASRSTGRPAATPTAGRRCTSTAARYRLQHRRAPLLRPGSVPCRAVRPAWMRPQPAISAPRRTAARRHPRRADPRSPRHQRPRGRRMAPPSALVHERPARHRRRRTRRHSELHRRRRRLVEPGRHRGTGRPNSVFDPEALPAVRVECVPRNAVSPALLADAP